MIGFLKNFLNGEKSPEEKALYAAQGAEKDRDVLVINAYADDDEEEDDLEEGGCGTGGCGGCGCRS